MYNLMLFEGARLHPEGHIVFENAVGNFHYPMVPRVKESLRVEDYFAIVNHVHHDGVPNKEGVYTCYLVVEKMEFYKK